MTRHRFHESHDLIVEPGPYPPGEGPADYATCRHRCRSLTVACVATWPADGWVEVDEADDDIDACTECQRQIGFSEHEYEGQYGLRLVTVWVPVWTHPDLPSVHACEDCSMVNWPDGPDA